MKIKFGNLTVYQAAQFCKRAHCEGCPLEDRASLCNVVRYACGADYKGCLEEEIELPDKKEDKQ